MVDTPLLLSSEGVGHVPPLLGAGGVGHVPPLFCAGSVGHVPPLVGAGEVGQVVDTPPLFIFACYLRDRANLNSNLRGQ